MMNRRRARAPAGAAGFTLIELLVVLALIGILLSFGVPAFLTTLNRAKLTGFAQQAAVAMQAARLEAVKRSHQVRVEAHFADNSVIAYVDDGDGVFNSATDSVVTQVQNSRYLVAGQDAGITLHGPGSMSTPNLNGIYSLDPAVDSSKAAIGGVAIFNSDGSVAKSGSFRFRDQRGNILEVLVSPQASARIAVRKFAGDPNGSDDPTQYFEANQGTGWTWN